MRELLNHDRIRIEEDISAFGIDRFLQEVASICAEKHADRRIEFAERESLREASGTDVPKTIDEVVGELFDLSGGGAVIDALITKVETLAATWKDSDMQRQCIKMSKALKTSAIREAWGITQ